MLVIQHYIAKIQYLVIKIYILLAWKNHLHSMYLVFKVEFSSSLKKKSIWISKVSQHNQHWWPEPYSSMYVIKIYIYFFPFNQDINNWRASNLLQNVISWLPFFFLFSHKENCFFFYSRKNNLTFFELFLKIISFSIKKINTPIM